MMEEFVRIAKFHGGIHPFEGKSLTEGKPLNVAPLLPQYVVPVQQGIGAPPVLIVNKGDHVMKGQRIANPGGVVSSALHSPTSGTIGDTVEITGPTGAPAQAVIIESDGKDEWGTGLEPFADWHSVDRDLLKKRIADAGIVGMGGAAFPTNVKLSPPPEKNIDTLIVNGAECEPYLTADQILSATSPEKVLTGAAVAAKILGISNIFIGIEENKPDAIARLSELAPKFKIHVVPLHVKYPQGAEKQLIFAITHREVVEGGLPMDVGCVVQNIGTCAAISDAVTLGHPLIERVTTVTGSPVVNPGNWLLRIGTPASKVLELCGGVKTDPAKMIFGGPMMGFAQAGIETPVMKNTSGILLLARDEVEQFEGNPCLRCGRCVNICPMKLLVPTISQLAESEKFDEAAKWFVMDCMECGACAYVCPAHRPLVQLMRRAKTEIAAKRRKK